MTAEVTQLSSPRHRDRPTNFSFSAFPCAFLTPPDMKFIIYTTFLKYN